jgi:phosphopantothenate-cysteine ligase
MNVVISGGGTIAPIDDVRHVANASTGRFSSEIAEACLRRGASVWHVHAPQALLPFARSATLDLEAADADTEFGRLLALREEYRSIRARLHFRPLQVGTVSEYAEVLRSTLSEVRPDVAFLAMAASDFEPTRRIGKISSDRDGLTVEMHPTPKVIRSVRDRCPSVFLVGFKLLSGSHAETLISEAEAACRLNRADVTVANDLQSLREGRHTIHLVRPGYPVETLGPGGSIAEGLVDRVFDWIAEKRVSEALR